MKEKIKKIIEKATGVSADKLSVEVSANKNFGDYSTNVAMVLKKNPEEIVKKISSDIFEKVEVKNGFINFFVADRYFINNLKNVNKDYGKTPAPWWKKWKQTKIIIDYTDANLFKEFHIGHLMSNVIGESLARIFKFQGADVKKVCYQSDIGLNAAKAIYGRMFMPNWTWDGAYAWGAGQYERNEYAKKKIIEINKKIYEGSDENINKIYEEGKKWSLEHFEEIYKKLGTEFNENIFESYVSNLGKEIIEKNLNKVFEKGENDATIFKGEKFGLHTRVFINSEGLPTYEAKDLGLAEYKYKNYKYDKSFIVTANEQNEYFKVMLCAMSLVNPKLAKRTKHIGHGMMRLPEGKMSSRTGKIVKGDFLIKEVESLVNQKIKDKEFSEEEKDEISEVVAIGAIKYSILKQSIGSDIIYDFDRSISFEGDSGPYLQYAYTRANSVLKKAKEEKIKPSFKKVPEKISQLEKMIGYFPEIVLKAEKTLEPHFITLYLTELAGTFNNYYAKNKIIDKDNKEISEYRIALTSAFAEIMKNGLWLLGIKTLEKM